MVRTGTTDQAREKSYNETDVYLHSSDHGVQPALDQKHTEKRQQYEWEHFYATFGAVKYH